LCLPEYVNAEALQIVNVDIAVILACELVTALPVAVDFGRQGKLQSFVNDVEFGEC
jgi:hypothetical protein